MPAIEIVNKIIDMRPLIKDLRRLYKQLEEGKISIRKATTLINAAGKEIEAAKTQLILCITAKDVSDLKELPTE